MGCFLYRAFDAQGQLLYVGIGQQWQARLKKHRSTAPWYWSIEDFSVHWYPDRPSARAAELRALSTEGPLWNKDGNSSGGAAVKAYDLERWQKNHSAVMDYYSGKGLPARLEGEAYAAYLAEMECLFEKRLAHELRLWRMLNRLEVLRGEALTDECAS